MKRSYLLLPFFCVAAVSQADEPPVQQYHYGLPLDIAKVISIEAPYDPYVCEVIDAKMTYLDSAGETKVVAYRKLSAGCLLKT
ncbi:DUF2790 domain-containing protein [Azotobacter beijerinckii]|uniref:DUF2790 domain-containing protein n=1 Tax=Azotobacter beijerinckii TaxID=170623 RepID=UPI0029535B3D|nr:DUF2790 domain-containing protein [Azotobacter beijerinckii]MDV7212457.1 DUF2790 domain-containing protein [Azotobacter beijerinckii]